MIPKMYVGMALATVALGAVGVVLVQNRESATAAAGAGALLFPEFESSINEVASVKIETAEEAALYNDMLTGLELHLALPVGTIKVYVLVERIEACFQLMEIRAALTPHFVGFNTGRWDYINSVADAMAWDPEFVHPNIDAIGMTYGYMRNYEDRVRRAVNTPDRDGAVRCWPGSME